MLPFVFLCVWVSLFCCVCMCFRVMRNLILLLFVVNCERFFNFLSLVETQNDHKITKIIKKNLYRTTLKRKQKWFVFDCFYVLWNRSNCDDGTRWNIIADSGSIETNEKNAGKCRDSTKRKFFGSAVSLLILVTICIFLCMWMFHLSNSLTSALFFVLYL